MYSLLLAAVVVSLLLYSRLHFEKIVTLAILFAVFSNGLIAHLGGKAIRPEVLIAPLAIPFLYFGRRKLLESADGVRRSCFLLLILWLLENALVSIAESLDRTTSLLLLLWTAVGIGYMVVSARFSRTRFIIDGSVTLSVISVASVLGWALAQSSGEANGFVGQDFGSSTFRVSGLCSEPDLMGGLCAMWLSLMFIHRRSLSPRLLSLSVPIIATAGLLTAARAAWIAMAVLAAFALSSIRAAATAWLRILGITGVAVVIALASGLHLPANLSGLTDRFGHLTDLSTGTGAYRRRGWDAAISDIHDSHALLTGLGFNSFSQRSPLLSLTSGETYLSNLWLSLIHDGGVIGLALFVTALLVLWGSWGARRQTAPLIFAFAVTAAFASPLFLTFPWLIFGLVSSGPTDRSP